MLTARESLIVWCLPSGNHTASPGASVRLRCAPAAALDVLKWH
jgi:hypothetical protein